MSEKEENSDKNSFLLHKNGYSPAGRADVYGIVSLKEWI
jgi:hypothetical protein